VIGRRPSARLAALAATAFALAAPAAAPAAPTFAKHYAGTVTGSFRAIDGNVKIDWKVTGLRYELYNARLARGTWGGNYRALRGTVTYTASGTDGECRWSSAGKLSFGRLSFVDGQVTFLQSARTGRYDYEGRATTKRQDRVTETCVDADGVGYTRPSQVTISRAGWWDTGLSQRFIPGARLKGSYRPHDRYGSVSWTWNLAPSR
jgi:hypothetical protein